VTSTHVLLYFDVVREVGHANAIAMKPRMSVIMQDIFLDARGGHCVLVLEV
jgi:hypothetical protein